MIDTNAHRSTGRPPYPRWLGLLPIGFVVWATTNHQHPAEILWLCNVSNLLLAVGLFSDNLRVLWLATVWLVLGAPLWFVDIFIRDEFLWHAPFNHVVAPALGIWAIRRQQAPRGAPRGTWMLAAGLGLALQGACRLWTPPALNINVSHETYRGLTGWLDSYVVYWLLTALSLSCALFIIERLLIRFVSARP